MNDTQSVQPCTEPLSMLPDALSEASTRAWTGDIRVTDGKELIGLVVFIRGEVAWAVGKGQDQDLRTILHETCGLTTQQATLLRSLADRTHRKPSVHASL
jgi:hypothetical protein